MPPFFETRHARRTLMPMHRHSEAYVALIVAGTYTESSVDGPVQCRPGTLVLHPAFHAHSDRFGSSDARVLNVILPAASSVSRVQVLSVPHLHEAMDIVRHAPEHIDNLCRVCVPHETMEIRDWHKAFLKALSDSDESVGSIARQLGVSAAHASRDLQTSFGIPPQALRRELRWRRSLELLSTTASLRDIAAACGFADQSHLTRVVRAHSGLTPARLREHIKSVQDTAAASPA